MFYTLYLYVEYFAFPFPFLVSFSLTDAASKRGEKRGLVLRMGSGENWDREIAIAGGGAKATRMALI